MIVCTGLDGANPLHMLASLGVLRLLDRDRQAPRLAWRRDRSAWRPVYEVATDVKGVAERCAAWLIASSRTAGVDPALRRTVAELKAQLKRQKEARKQAERRERQVARAEGLSKEDAAAQVAERTAAECREVERLAKDLDRAQRSLALGLGRGVAHLGDVVGVPSSIARTAMEGAVAAWREASPCVDVRTDDPVLVLDQLAALCCDALVTNEGTVEPTPYSFSNGASNQFLLKDFRTCAALADAARVEATLVGGEARFVAGPTDLNWDPAGQRSYALGWRDPGATASRRRTDVAANALAYLGLGWLPAVPTLGGLAAVGWRREAGWTWPLWEAPLPPPVVRSLLADAVVAPGRPSRRRGVAEVRQSARINPTGKRHFFAPSRVVG